jgi:hypothetical protein
MKIKIKLDDQDINDVLETAEGVKGEKFADFVKFLVTTRQAFEITALLLQVADAEDLLEEDTVKIFKNITTINFAQMTTYCNAIGNFSETETNEATNLCDVILKKVNK